jgi:ubiquitin C-terminal hydrolase
MTEGVTKEGVEEGRKGGEEEEGDRWYYISDQYYSKVPVKTILSANSEAYLLFYQKI